MDDVEKLLLAIKKHCLRCAGTQKDVENCTSGPDAAPYSQCLLWYYRLGTIIIPEKKKRKRKEE